MQQYEKTPVLRDESFTAQAGTLLAILGPNGAGKTTLFRCILGEQTRYIGTITVDGADARTLSARALAHRISPLSAPREAQREIAYGAMRRIGIESLAEHDFSHLSGGEQQLVYIARALAQQTKILLMDEPTSSLDYGNQLAVLSTVRTLADDGYTVLLSTHNPQHAIWYADGILALHNGAVAAQGPTREQLTPNLLKTLYGTDIRMLRTDSGPVILPNIHKEEQT